MTSWRPALVAAGVTLLAGCSDSGRPLLTRLTRHRSAGQAATGDAILARAESLSTAGEYGSVVALLTPALADSRRRGDPTAETRILTRLGLATRKGDPAASRRYLEDALRRGTASGLDAELVDVHNGLGLVSQDADRNEEAREHFAETMRIAQRVHDRRGLAKASGNLGLTLAYLGDLREAHGYLSAMRDSGRALGDWKQVGNAMANIAMVDIWEGQANSAIPTLDSARAIYRKVGYVAGEQNALGQLATAYEEIGEYGQAFAAFDSSLALARAKAMTEDEVEILGLIASLHARLGDYRAAMRSYEETAAAATRLDMAGELGIVRRNTAQIHLELGDVERARADAVGALAIHQKTGAQLDQLDDLLLLAEIANRAGRSTETVVLLKQATAISESLGTRGSRLAVALTTARLADRAGDSQRVMTTLRGVDSTAVPGDFAVLAEVYSLVARAYGRRGMLDSAVVVGARAIASVERVRADLASEPLRRALLADRSAVYAEQVVSLLGLHRDAEAFSVADAARSRGLVDYLASARADLRSRASSGGVREGEELLRRIDVLLARLKSMDSVPMRERGPSAGTATAELMARIEKARADYESFLIRRGREQSRAGALLGVDHASLEEVQRALDPQEALLEYLVASDRIVIFVATSTALRTLQVTAPASALADRVRLLRELWGVPESDWRQGLPAARALDEVLLAHVRSAGALDGIHRLVIVPHGILSQVPFAALVDGQTGHFLAQDFEVLYLPSGGTLPALRAGALDGSPTLGGTAFAPFPRELPASAAEVAAVQRVIPGIAANIGEGATELSVRDALGRHGIVHVASHATLNSRNPMFAAIELAGDSQGNSANDGRLEVHELLGARVRSSLVFLSGCETSVTQSWLDDAVRGTDYTTLAQALLYAGAENVVGTLWRVDDAGAATFAERFYSSLAQDGLTRGLASAQRIMIQTPKFSRPYYWAGYVLTGVGELSSYTERRGNSHRPSVPLMSASSKSLHVLQRRVHAQ